ncbi:MAG TPA: InlB B-repeat-containing protein [Gryllotalpicola sp.]
MLRVLRRTRPTIIATFVATFAIVAALLTVGATTPASAAPSSAAAVGASTSTPTVALGSSVTIDFATSTPYAKDWVAFYSSGAVQGTCPSPATYWAYTSSGTTTAGSTATASGSVTFNTSGWALGTYSVYLCQNDGYTSIGTPIKVSVVALSAAATTVPQGGTLSFDFGAPASQLSASNWIGLYSTAGGNTPGQGGSTYWNYTNSGTQTAGATAVATGSMSFSTAGWPIGTYTAYFLYNDGYTLIGAPLVITIAPPTADVLDVDFASGAPVDHAQGLAATTVGAPKVAKDPTIGQNTAAFNGSTDAYQFDLTSSYPKLTKSVSLECEFTWNGTTIPGGTSAWPSECSSLQNGGLGFIVYNGKLDFEINVGGYKDIYVPISAGTWYDAIGTWDGSTVNVYLDGALAATAAVSGTMTVPTTTVKNFNLGSDLSGSGGAEQFAPVSVGAARIWSTALSAAGAAAQSASTLPFEPITVTKSGQGTASASVPSALPGTKVTLSATPATGFTFSGWQVTNPSDGSVTVAADGTFTMPGVPVTVQANFAPYHYTVHYDGNGADGGSMADGSFAYGTATRLAADGYTRDGYHFAGWATSPSGKPVYADSASVLDLSAVDGGSVTLYAVWHGGVSVPAPDILNVDFADGTPVDHAQNLEVTAVGSPTIATDPALGTKIASFDGFSSAYSYAFGDSYSKLTSGFTVECDFRWDGALPDSSSGSFPSICSAEQSGGTGLMYYHGALMAEAYVGGYKDAVDPNPLVVGQWYDAVETWDGANLALYLDGKQVASVAAAGTLTLPASSALNWNLGADLNGSGTTEQYGPVSLSMARIWSSALSAGQVAAIPASNAGYPVTVTQSGQGTASATPDTATQSADVTLSASAAVGYSFGGWQVTEPAGLKIGSDSTITMPAQPVTANANFAPNGYTVHFDGNGAESGSIADRSLSYDTPATLPTSAFTRPGYYFAGWSTSPTALPTYADGASVLNLASDDGATVDLYAFWVANGDYLIALGSTAGGTATASTQTAAPGDQVTLTATPETGYHFTGWAVVTPTDGSLTVHGDTFTMPSEAVSIQASFIGNSYTVAFNGNGSDSGKMTAETFSYGEPAALTASVYSRDGYVFTGWATTADGAVAYADGATVSNLNADDGGSVTLYAVWKQLATTPGSWSSLPGGFVTGTLHLSAAPLSGVVSQRLLGLWNGTAPTSFTKVSGDDWLSVSSDGVVSGTAPAAEPDWAGEITVSATNGSVTSQILVEVPVQTAPTVQTASWNAWADGSSVTDAVGKNLIAVASRGIGVIGFQDGGSAMAQQLGAALGWHVYASGDLGLVSAYPFTGAARIAASATVPAVAATVDVDGQDVRVWDAYLDESAKDTAARATQATAIADAAQRELFTAAQTPVVLLGDLGSADLADTFTATGLSDTYRRANPDADAAPGATWPVFPASAADATRVDYVLEAGTGLGLSDSDELSAGRPSGTAPAGNSWASDHAAVVTTFTVGDASSAPTPPTVTTGTSTIAYQIGHSPAGIAAFLSDVDATADQTGTTLTADLGSVDFSVAGWYTAQIVAAHDGAVSAPVSVAVRVAPIPKLTLGSDTATFAAGDRIDQKAVLGQLTPVFTGDGTGTETVDLSGVTGVGTFPVVVTAKDEWGFTATADATVTVVLTEYTISYDLAGGSVTIANPTMYDYESDDITLSNPTRYAYDFAGWTGTGLSGATKTVKIPTGSTGDRSYTATWKQAAASWSASTVYATAGTTVFYQGKLYTSLWWTQGEVPGSNANGAWQEVGAPVTTAQGTHSAWTASWVYNGGETVVYDGKLYRAAWYTRNEQPGDPNGAWEQIGEPVVTTKGAFGAWTASWIYNGGETVAYRGHLYTARWYSRNQAPGAANGPWQDLGAY